MEDRDVQEHPDLAAPGHGSLARIWRMSSLPTLEPHITHTHGGCQTARPALTETVGLCVRASVPSCHTVPLAFSRRLSRPHGHPCTGGAPPPPPHLAIADGCAHTPSRKDACLPEAPSSDARRPCSPALAPALAPAARPWRDRGATTPARRRRPLHHADERRGEGLGSAQAARLVGAPPPRHGVSRHAPERSARKGHVVDPLLTSQLTSAALVPSHRRRSRSASYVCPLAVRRAQRYLASRSSDACGRWERGEVGEGRVGERGGRELGAPF
jgi:hypothetical protein